MWTSHPFSTATRVTVPTQVQLDSRGRGALLGAPTARRADPRMLRPGCGLDPVTLDGAIADADVPRGSAYRLWQDDNFTPQQSYRRAVQVAVLERAGQGVESMTAKFKETRDEYSVYLESDAPEDRDWAFWTILRIVANHSFERLDGSRCWRLYQALRGCVDTVQPRAHPVADAVHRRNDPLRRHSTEAHPEDRFVGTHVTQSLESPHRIFRRAEQRDLSDAWKGRTSQTREPDDGGEGTQQQRRP